MDIQRRASVSAFQLPLEQRVAIPQNDAGAAELIAAAAQRNLQGLPVDRYDTVLRDYLSSYLRLLKFIYFHPDTAYQALRLPLPRVHGLIIKISAMTRFKFFSRFLPPELRYLGITESQSPSAQAHAYDPVRSSGIHDRNIESFIIQAMHSRSSELLDNCIHYLNSHPKAEITILHCPDETLSLRVEGGTVPAGIARALQHLAPQISKVSFSQTSASAQTLSRPMNVEAVAQKIHRVWEISEQAFGICVEFCTIGYFIWHIQSVAQTAFSCLSTFRAAAFTAISVGYWVLRGKSVQLPSISQGIPEKSIWSSLQEGHVLLNSTLSSWCFSAYRVGLPTLINIAMKTGIGYRLLSKMTRTLFKNTIFRVSKIWENWGTDCLDRVWRARPRPPHSLISQLPSTLRELDLSQAWDLQDHHLLAIAERCPGLQKLTIGNRAQLTRKGWDLLARFSRLNQLQISIKNGEGFGDLRRLQLANRSALRIDLRCESTTLTRSLKFLDNLPRGVELSLHIKADGSSGLSAFLAHAQNLVSLRLEGWGALTDRHCEQIAVRHPSIRELRASVSGIREGMRILASGCGQLEMLALKGYSEIAGLEELVRKNPYLRVVRLMNASSSTMNRVSQLPYLQEVILFRGDNITEKHIQQLLTARPGLDLTIGELSQVTPALYQRVADSTYQKRQAQAFWLEQGLRKIFARGLQIYDRRQVEPFLDLGFTLLVDNPPTDLINPALLGLPKAGRWTEISTAQLSTLARLLPASSYKDLKKRLSVIAEEYTSLVKGDFDLEKFGDYESFADLWARSFQRFFLKVLLRETPGLKPSYSRYLQENYPRLDLGQLSEWSRELQRDMRAIFDLHKSSVQQLGSVFLSLVPGDNQVFKTFQKQEFAVPFKRFLESICTHADQKGWNEKERWAAVFYGLFQDMDWLEAYLDMPS